MTAVEELGCSKGSGACPVRPWVCHPWRWNGDTLVWFKGGHQLCQPWRLLGGDPLQAELSPSLCRAQGHLAGATEQSAGGRHAQRVCRHLQRPICRWGRLSRRYGTGRSRTLLV